MATTFTPEIKQVSQQYLRRLKELDSQVLSDLAREYVNVYHVARSEWESLSRKIIAAQQRGEAITPGWLFQQGRLDRFSAQVGSQLDSFVNDLNGGLTAAQNQAIAESIRYAQASANAALGPVPHGADFSQFWTNLNQQAVQQILSNTAEGGPVYKVLQSLAPQGASEARDIITNGVAQGYNPRKVASELRDTLDVSLTRAQTIARTEMMRAARDTVLETYRENSDVVQGWIWSAACDDNTCEDCWAMDGEVFDTEVDTEMHVNCRCTLEPDVSSYADLGFGADVTGGIDEEAAIEETLTGPEKFAQLPESSQLKVLGPAKFRAYQDGAITLRDLVGHTESPVWGRSIRTKSLKEVLGKDAQKYYGDQGGSMTPAPRALSPAQPLREADPGYPTRAASRARTRARSWARLARSDGI